MRRACARRAGSRWMLVTVALPLLAIVAGCSEASLPPDPPTTPECLAALNEGAAAMGAFDLDAAEAAFAKAIVATPDNRWARLNAAIARLNQPREGAQDEALLLFAPLVDDAIVGTRAAYCTAMAEIYAGRHERALVHLDRVASAAPNDAFVHYYRAQCLELKGDVSGARAEYARAVECDGYLRSALLGLERCDSREGRVDAAKEWLAQFDAQADNPRSHLAQFKYTRMGPLAEVALPSALDPASVRANANAKARPEGPLFDAWAPIEIAEWPRTGHAASPWLRAVGDIDRDGRSDMLWQQRGGADQAATLLVALGSSEKSWRIDSRRTIGADQAISSVYLGDLDNDGREDIAATTRAVAATPSRIFWWRQGEDAAWSERSFGDAAHDGDEVRLVADLDHDSDLDLAVAGRGAEPNTGALAILYNRGDGTWERRTILNTQVREPSQVLARDLDLDGDLDLVAITFAMGASRSAVLINDRLWAWSRDPVYQAFEAAPAIQGVAFSRASDGAPLVAIMERRPNQTGYDADLVVWQFGRGTPAIIGRREFGRAHMIAVADVTGEGRSEILIGGISNDIPFSEFRMPAPSIHRFDDRAQPLGAIESSERNEYDTAHLAILNGSGVVLIADDMRIRWPGSGRAPIATVAFRGRVDPSQQMRSNASGVGTTGVARVRDSWVPFAALPWNSSLGQSTDPCIIGLGDAPRADYLSIDWPDGVLQTERSIDAGAHTVVETQRQISSCPVIFAFNGTRMEFVTDCLGVGGLGYLATVSQAEDGSLDGVYAPPRSWERVLLPTGALVAREGRFDIALEEPMEEFTALDEASLVAYDLPPGWSLTLDERMGIMDPQPTGDALYYREALVARDASISRLDGVAFDTGAIDPRFIGKTAKAFTIPLDFGEALDGRNGDPVLLIDGWIEYPYCQTNFAIWQAKEALSPPTIEALDPATGAWKMLRREFGYPAGMPREAAFPLPPGELPLGCKSLRMTTNHELYVDRVRVAFVQPAPEVRVHRMHPSRARVAECGFARRTTLAQRRPYYDCETRAPLWDCRLQRGRYTRTDADCAELLQSEDGARAIFGSGEGVEIGFTDVLPQLEAGWTRRFVLDLRGNCKDMDPLTQNGSTVEPLPPPVDDRARELDDRFNARREGGR